MKCRLRCWSFELVERLQKFHGRSTVERIAAISTLIEPLQVRRQLHPFFNKQDEIATVKSHGGSDLNENVAVNLRMRLTFIVQKYSLRSNVNNRSLAASHVVENLIRHGL